MFKFAVLSLLVVACSALPYGQSNFRYGQTGFVSQPRAYGGFRSGYSGLSTGFSGLGYGAGYGSGYGYGGLRTGYSGALVAAPVATQSYSVAPIATSTLVAAPVQTLGYSQNLGYAQNNLNLLNVRQGQQFEQVVPAAIQQISRTVEYRHLANQEQPIQAQIVEVEPSDNPVHLHFKTRSSTLSTSQSHVAAGPTEVQSAAAQDEPQRLITEVQKPVIQEVKEVISPFRQVTQEINPVVESLHTIVTKGDGYRQQYQGANIGAQYNTGYSGYQNVVAAPAVSSIAYQTAPVVETVGLVSSPTIAVQSAPALTSSYSTLSAPSSFSSYGGTYGKQIGFSKPISTGYQSYSSTY